MNEYRLLEAIELRPNKYKKFVFIWSRYMHNLVLLVPCSGVLAANVVAGYDNMIDICLKNNIVSDLQKIEGKKYN